MKKRLSAILVLFLLAFILGMSAKTDAYSEPREALIAKEKDVLVIPSYLANNKALFFFINSTDNLGAAYVQKGLFGWKTGMLTWSPMDQERKYEKLSGYQGYGENLIYGIIRNGDKHMVQIGEEHATILDLTAVLSSSEVEKFKLDGLSIWYYESDDELLTEDEKEIILVDKDTGEELDMIY
ncbi:aspartyl-tRNA synthetase [Sporosarcina cyprini]|uniref:aspartyl-tRNA synthetase n=1 Tax=Sporosarcina cyprini TaxID=2910523 RepID=UPI001EDE04A3|nr:aspartyl-tRNA synthetase [Sporosarcina cyprini]MCG3088702.1 aspartyl-tRNA synthetase [Sporosarcina cyprini]